MPTPTDRSAALARLRAYLALEPGSAPPPSHDDLRVLLNPNAQAIALAAENERLRTAFADATAGLDSAWRDLMAIGAAADAFYLAVGAEPGSLTPAQIITAAAQHHLDAEHLRSTCCTVIARAAAAPDHARALPPPPDYLLPDGPDLACPGCGGRVHWGGIDEDGVGAAYCARSSFACTRADQPEIGDGTCEWSGRVRRVEGGGIEVAP